MKNLFLLGIALASAVLLSCHKKTISETKITKDSNQKDNAIKTVVMDPSADISATGSPYKIDSLALHGDVLSIFVNYGGGCNNHTFELISNNQYAKSLPPQITLCLKHTGNDDTCKKLIMQELKFDVSGIKFKGTATTVIKIGTQKVTYIGN